MLSLSITLSLEIHKNRFQMIFLKTNSGDHGKKDYNACNMCCQATHPHSARKRFGISMVLFMGVPKIGGRLKFNLSVDDKT